MEFHGLADAGGDVLVAADGFTVRRLELSGRVDRDLDVFLVPSPGIGERRVQFVDAFDGHPIEGVAIQSRRGPVADKSSAEGELLLPPWLVGDARLELSGPDRIPVVVFLDDLLSSNPVRLVARSELLLEILVGVPAVGDALQRWTCIVDIESWPEGCAGSPDSPLLVTWTGNSSPPIVLPRGIPSRLTVFSDREEIQSLVVEPILSTERRDVVPSVEEGLSVYLQFPEGRQRPWTLRSSFGSEQTFMVSVKKGGHAFLPLTERARGQLIELLAPGCAPLRILAINDVPLSGRLDLSMVDALSAHIRVLDFAGTPLSGMDVSLSGSATERGNAPDPRSSEQWLTNHPGWVIVSNNSQTQTTDEEGRVEVGGLYVGNYLAGVRLGLIRGGSSARIAMTRQSWHRIRVSGADDETVIEASGLAWHSFRFVDKHSRVPVANVFVSSRHGTSSQIGRSEGSVWEGWILDSWADLDVGALGYEGIRIDVAQLEENGVHLVELGGKANCTVAVDGGATWAEGFEVRADVMRDILDERGNVRWTTTVGHVSARLTDGELVFGVWPISGVVDLRLLPIEVNGEPWEFSPAQFPLTAEGGRVLLRRAEQ